MLCKVTQLCRTLLGQYQAWSAPLRRPGEGDCILSSITKKSCRTMIVLTLKPPGQYLFYPQKYFRYPCVATVVHGDTQLLWQLWTWASLMWPLTSVLLYLSGPCLRCHEESWWCHWFKGTQVIPVGLDLCNVTKQPIILQWVHHTQSYKEKTFLEPVC